MIRAGEPAPQATLRDGNGVDRTLADLWSQGPILLVFYPGDGTPVCTRQLCEYRDRYDVFTRHGVRILGINPADPGRHARFRAKHRFPFDLLSDIGQVAARAYGARAWWGIRRRCILIDGTGIIRAVVDGWPFRPPPFQALVEALAGLDEGSEPSGG